MVLSLFRSVSAGLKSCLARRPLALILTKYQNVYPGINLVYYGNPQQLE